MSSGTSICQCLLGCLKFSLKGAMNLQAKEQLAFRDGTGLCRMGKVSPNAIDHSRIGPFRMDVKAVARAVGFSRLDAKRTERGRGKAEVRLLWMEASRLWKPEIIRMAQDRDAAEPPIDPAVQINPPWTGLVAVLPGLSLTRKVFAVPYIKPITVPSDRNPPV